MNTNDRPLEIAAFLDQNQWGTAGMQPFEGDFSSRRYARLTRDDGQSAILMDADADQKTPQFVSIAKILRDMDIHAPEIYAALPERGLVLLEDLGTRNVGALLDAGEKPERFFLQAAENLARIHTRFDRSTILGLDLPLYTAELFTAQAGLFLDAYFPFVKGRDASEEEKDDFRAAWQAVLRPLETLPKSLILRDFMPDNAMDTAKGKLAVVDFQDAGVGSIAYDMASYCEEVRRDGGFAQLPKVVAHYRQAAASPLSESDLMRACIILSAQRHTRILGIVTQLAIKKGRREKLVFLPRIERHLRNVLNEPYLAPVREWMRRVALLPGQTP